MVANQCCFGTVTSATRTYFVQLMEQSRAKNKRVLVTDAWFVGQPNYLRAWAAFYAFARENRPSQNNSAWVNTPTKIRDNRNLYGDRRENRRTGRGDQRGQARGGRGRGGRGHQRSCGDIDTIPDNILCEVPLVERQDIELLEPLGHGRQGTLFKVRWQGNVYAAKVFDTTKGNGLDAFKRETQAYEHLRGAWGRLIPTPRFIVTNTTMVLFLGMDLAEEPTDDDDRECWDGVLEELEADFGFRHLDVDCDLLEAYWRNRMWLANANKTEAEEWLPIVVDLEDYELVDHVSQAPNAKQDDGTNQDTVTP